MGVDVRASFPPDVGPDHLATALAALASLPIRLESLTETAIHAVTGIHAKPTSVCNMSRIDLSDGRGCYVHAAVVVADTNRVVTLLSTRSSPWWCAAARRLVDFFGGEVEFQDCGDGPTYQAKRGCPVNAHGMIPDDGEAWNAYQRAVAGIEPLTEKEIEAGRVVAAYSG